MRKNKREFVELIERYLKGDCTQEEQLFVERWYSSIGSKKATLADFTNQTATENLEKTEFRLRNKLHQHVTKGHVKERKIVVMWRYAAAAACLIVALGSGFYIMSPQIKKPQVAISKNNTSETIVFHAKLERRSIKLTDGSQIVLEPQSELRFNESPGDRVIHLTGEASFDVAPDKTRPFYVYASGFVTKVLGTVFTIKALEGSSKATVSVREGKVSVYSSVIKNGHPKELILLPNQEAEYDGTTQQVESRLVANPVQVKTTNEEVHYKEKPIGEILNDMEKMYGIKIRFDKKAFDRCVLTTTFSEEGFYNRLDIICSAIGSTYKKVDTQILLSNPNCSKP